MAANLRNHPNLKWRGEPVADPPAWRYRESCRMPASAGPKSSNVLRPAGAKQKQITISPNVKATGDLRQLLFAHTTNAIAAATMKTTMRKLTRTSRSKNILPPGIHTTPSRAISLASDEPQQWKAAKWRRREETGWGADPRAADVCRCQPDYRIRHSNGIHRRILTQPL